jgi:hypothetical protein
MVSFFFLKKKGGFYSCQSRSCPSSHLSSGLCSYCQASDSWIPVRIAALIVLLGSLLISCLRLEGMKAASTTRSSPPNTAARCLSLMLSPLIVDRQAPAPLPHPSRRRQENHTPINALSKVIGLEIKLVCLSANVSQIWFKRIMIVWNKMYTSAVY